MSTLKDILQIFIGLLVGLLSAFVLSQLWGWFISSSFDLPKIGTKTAYGIYLIFGLLTVGIKKIDYDKEKAILNMIGTFIAVLFVWGLGAAIHYWL